MNTFIGALLAAIIATGTAMTTLLMGDGVTLDNIMPKQWLVIGVGFLVTFAKDFQAIWTREKISKVTKSNDGGF